MWIDVSRADPFALRPGFFGIFGNISSPALSLCRRHLFDEGGRVCRTSRRRTLPTSRRTVDDYCSPIMRLDNIVYIRTTGIRRRDVNSWWRGIFSTKFDRHSSGYVVVYIYRAVVVVVIVENPLSRIFLRNALPAVRRRAEKSLRILHTLLTKPARVIGISASRTNDVKYFTPPSFWKWSVGEGGGGNKKSPTTPIKDNRRVERKLTNFTVAKGLFENVSLFSSKVFVRLLLFMRLHAL